MQTARDTYNQLEYAKKKGREEGLEKGLKQGRREIATNMLRNGLSIQTICNCTGLSAEEITKLQSEA